MSSLDTTSPRGRHPVNVGHLVMGLAFLGLTAVWGAVQTDLVDSGEVRWLLPLPWVLAGLAGLLAVAFSGRRDRSPAPSPDPPPAPSPGPAAPDETLTDEPTLVHDDTEESR
jgi:hypothetical protein